MPRAQYCHRLIILEIMHEVIARYPFAYAAWIVQRMSNVGMRHQMLNRTAQCLADDTSRSGIIFDDKGAQAIKVIQRLIGKVQLHFTWRGGGSSWSVPQLSIQRSTASPSTTRPACTSAKPRSIEARTAK